MWVNYNTVNGTIDRRLLPHDTECVSMIRNVYIFFGIPAEAPRLAAAASPDRAILPVACHGRGPVVVRPKMINNTFEGKSWAITYSS